MLEQLPPRLMTELQMKTQKKLMKMQKAKTATMSPVKEEKSHQPIPAKKVNDCLTMELIAHVLCFVM